MKPIEPKLIRLLLDDRNADNPKMVLNKAKAAVTAARPANKDAPMSDAECLAYSQTLFVAESQSRHLMYEQERIYRKLTEKYKTFDIEDFHGDPEYQKITQSVEESKKVGMNLFKQALMRNPSDEQLRLLCAGSIYRSEFLQDISCVKILEEPEIARDEKLSTRIIDAAIQWQQAVDSDSLRKKDDFTLVKEFMIKNFTPKVIVAAISNDKASDLSRHPSYSRGVHLLKKLEQGIKEHKILADDGMRYVGETNPDVLRNAFRDSPHFAKAYADLEQTYIEAYIQRAKDKLEQTKAHTFYEDAKQTSSAKTASKSGSRADY